MFCAEGGAKMSAASLPSKEGVLRQRGGVSCGKGGIKVSAVLLPPDAFARQGGGRPVAKGLLKVKVSIVLLTPGEDFQ